MAKSVYEIVIDAQYKGKGVQAAEKDVKGLNNAVGDLDGGVQKSEKSLMSMGIQAGIAGLSIGAVGVAAKKAYEFIGEGAELEFAAGKFDNLSVSINTTGDALLGKMKIATKGMISDAQLVASGSDIMSLGLAKTEDGVIRMATAVGALDLDMQVLALTLANDSTMRLDNLGLSLETVTKRKKELIASGFIGDAFDEAVLIELEQKMLLLGDASETTAGKMKIIEASFADISDAAKIFGVNLAAVPLSEFSSDLVTFLDEVDRVNAAFSDLEERAGGSEGGLDKATSAISEYVKMLNPSVLVMKAAGVYWDELIERTDTYTEVTARAARETADADFVMTGYAMTTAEVTQRVEENELAEQQLLITRVAGMDASRNYADALYDVEAAELATTAAGLAAQEVIAGRVASFGTMTSAMSGLSATIAGAWGEENLAELEDNQGEWITVTVNNAAEIAAVNERLNSDLDRDQLAHYNDVLKNAEEGGAAWLAAYSAIQDDMTDSQRAALVAQRADLSSASGEIQSIYTGDAEALEAAAARQAAANEAITQSYNDVALAIVQSGLQESTMADGGADAETAALGYIAMQQALGTITQEEAAQLQQVALETLAIADATDEMTARFLADGQLTTAEAQIMAAEIGRIEDEVRDIPSEYTVAFKSDLSQWQVPSDFGGQQANQGGGEAEFADGGYTGGGASSSYAGLVHKNEFVFDSQAVNNLGVDTLNAMHEAAKNGGGGGSTYTIDARGSNDPAAVEAAVARAMANAGISADSRRRMS